MGNCLLLILSRLLLFIETSSGPFILLVWEGGRGSCRASAPGSAGASPSLVMLVDSRLVMLPLSTDQVEAFVELARQGSLRAAAQVLHITEQGVRNRLLALEGRLRVQLYRKQRGVRRGPPLTEQGKQF